jgi:anti-anti-sigma factor
VRVVVEPLVLKITQFDDSQLVAVGGEIDLNTAPELDEVLTKFDSGQVTVDLADVTFIDSTGVRVLIEAYERLGRGGGTLTVRDASPPVLRVFEITGLDQLLCADGWPPKG